MTHRIFAKQFSLPRASTYFAGQAYIIDTVGTMATLLELILQLTVEGSRRVLSSSVLTPQGRKCTRYPSSQSSDNNSEPREGGIGPAKDTLRVYS